MCTTYQRHLCKTCDNNMKYIYNSKSQTLFKDSRGLEQHKHQSIQRKQFYQPHSFEHKHLVQQYTNVRNQQFVQGHDLCRARKGHIYQHSYR